MNATRLHHTFLTDYDDTNIPDHFNNIILPEHRLLWCILARAVADALGNIGRCDGLKKIKADAWCWIFYPKHLDEFHEFSFEGICEELGLRPTILRKFIAKQRMLPEEQRIKIDRRINIQFPYKKSLPNN